MDSNDFQKKALRTETIDLAAIKERTGSDQALRLRHAAYGMQTEAAEFTDMLKKAEFYGKPLDRVNLLEELGDQLWYIAIALDTLDSSFEEVMGRNIAKLQARYPEKFTEDSALNRNLETERKILEGGE